jgi:hypothetical protein
MKNRSTNNKVPLDVSGGSGHLGSESTQSVPTAAVNYTKPIPVDAGAWPPAGDEDGQRSVKLGKVLDKFQDPCEGWSSKEVKEVLHEEYSEWLASLVKWSNYLTLTFKEYKTPDQAWGTYVRLVHALNEKLFGDHYTRIVGHSYFNYICGMEFTRSRAVCHFHVLTDRPMDYTFIHAWWNKCAGICWIEQVKDRMKALHYVTKYVCKGGNENLKVYLQSNHRVPRPLPLWWMG